MLKILFLLVAVIMVAACRGSTSDKPPIHLVPNMDSQPKYKAQSESDFFRDKSSMRLPVAGTMARGGLKENQEWYAGKDASGNFIAQGPLKATDDVVKRGEERYGIYCTPCHGTMGDGKGEVTSKGFPPPPSFHNQRAYDFADGFIFDRMTSGGPLMPSYAQQIPVKDRWAIVAFIRALQAKEKNK